MLFQPLQHLTARITLVIPPQPPHTPSHQSHSESSIDGILAPLGDAVKEEVLRGEPSGADELNDSALWAYDDPQS